MSLAPLDIKGGHFFARSSKAKPKTLDIYCVYILVYSVSHTTDRYLPVRTGFGTESQRIVPKGSSLDDFTQEDITLMMNHINSYARPNLGDKTPYEVFAMLYGEDILKEMGVELIPPDKITLHPSLLKK